MKYMDNLTLEVFSQIPNGKVFAEGVIADSPMGINMSNSGMQLRWAAKKGDGDESWAIYCYWSTHQTDWIIRQGDKVTSESSIRRVVRCSDEVFKLYRK